MKKFEISWDSLREVALKKAAATRLKITSKENNTPHKSNTTRRKYIEDQKSRERIIFETRRSVLSRHEKSLSNEISEQSPRIFLSYEFSCVWSDSIERETKRISNEVGIHVITGHAHGASKKESPHIIEETRKRIEYSDIFLCVFSSPDPIASSWLYVEFGIALALRKPLAIITHQDYSTEHWRGPAGNYFNYEANASQPFESYHAELIKKAIIQLNKDFLDFEIKKLSSDI